ncbi:Uu.00g048320.m01.CDS01 [Anthostomella pinea]|uniref:Uu.00g048320.m01.CDS01 n=1 Tax=Anthostomella pinea TaxID=933095 RepID=A0AAI8VBP8_9PEZI|nr:Uu.00g048320.m01.CDS01 [Anthostomella pinea]
MALRSIWTKVKHERGRIGRFGFYLFTFATWIPVATSFNDYVAELTWINGPSMYPFLNAEKDQTTRKDVVLTVKHNAQYGLKHGMIVTFWNPSDPEVITVKRVVGVAGDIIRTRNPYPVPTARVPPGHVWVEGDGGERDSRDSNTYGPIATGLIIGKVTHVIWPLHRFGKVMSLDPRVADLSTSTPPYKTSDRPVTSTAFLEYDGLSEHTTSVSDISCTGQSHRPKMTQDDGESEGRPPYVHSMIAGGIGGTTGDMLMHSLDTVKTRQQGDPHFPPKYTSLGSSYYKIWRQEGIRRGLYGGWLPAMMGSFPGTVMFFGTYEWSKRHMLDYGIQSHVSYLTAGFLGDLAASIVYVPSEVLKTRLQLQGRHNNPFFKSGYNYRGTIDAARTIVRTEGLSELFSGYRATIYRDLPFSALQFMFYEQFQSWARDWKESREIGVPLELATGAAGGGLAGVMTCPLDVVKTRLQTQIDPVPVVNKPTDRATTEGISGWFRGVGPRFVWTSVQSGCMLFLYQTILRRLETLMPLERPDMSA